MDSKNIRNTPSRFEFSDPQQAKLHGDLKLFGEAPAAFYRDACAIMSEHYEFECATHIVGHLLRELLYGLQKVFIPLAMESNLKGDREKTSYLLGKLGFSNTDFVWVFWVDNLISGDFGLHSFAHRAGLARPRQLDSAFESFWNDFNAFLGQFLDSAKDHLLELAKDFDEIAEKEAPAAADIAAVSDRLAHHPVYLNRFFDKIKSELWLKPLDEKGYFEPVPTATVVAGYIQAEPWPQGRLLRRIASICPKDVIAILARIDWPWNPYFIHDIIEIISIVDPPALKPLIKKLVNWIETHGIGITADSLGELIEKLGGSETSYGLRLSRKYLEYKTAGEDHGFLSSPQTIVESYLCQELVEERLNVYVQTDALETLGLLCQKLDEGIALYVSDFTSPELVSDMHRCTLVDDSNDERLHGFLEHLVIAIRNHSLNAIAKEQLTVVDLCELFDNYEHRVFLRLKVFIISRDPVNNKQIACELLLDRELFGARWLSREYIELSRRLFKHLSAGQKQQYLLMISQIVSLSHSEKDPSDVQYEERQQLIKLAAIADALPEEWDKKYQELRDKYPDVLNAETEEGVQLDEDESLSFDELAAMEGRQVADYVRTWDSSPNRDDWGNQYTLQLKLANLVASDPQKFVGNFDHLHDLPPDLRRWIFSGLRDACRQKKDFDWSNTLDFATGVYRDSLSANSYATEEPEEWPGELRKSILWLLHEGVSSNEHPIAEKSIDDVLEIIEMGICDADPSVTGEARWRQPGKARDAAINCTRGIAYEVVAGIIERFKTDSALQERQWPRLKKHIEEYLGDPQSHRIVVHLALGQLFPRFLEIDEEWSLENQALIFPEDTEQQNLFAAAWEGYVEVWDPNRKLFVILDSQYRYACENFDSIIGANRHAGTDLARHIVGAFGNEVIGLEDELLAKLFNNASVEIRINALRQAGQWWSTVNVEKFDERQFGLKMQAIYQWRREINERSADSAEGFEEVWAIDNWPSDGFASKEWWLGQVASLLSNWKRVGEHPRFTEHLAKCANTNPIEVLGIIRQISDSDLPAWAMSSMHKHLKDSFQAIILLNISQFTEEVRKLINRFSTRGYTGFEEVFSE